MMMHIHRAEVKVVTNLPTFVMGLTSMSASVGPSSSSISLNGILGLTYCEKDLFPLVFNPVSSLSPCMNLPKFNIGKVPRPPVVELLKELSRLLPLLCLITLEGRLDGLVPLPVSFESLETDKEERSFGWK